MTKLTPIARTLRKHDTRTEKLLWTWLRDRRFSTYKFRRQHTFGPHILDFFCLEAWLNIELDGSQHGFPEQKKKDTERDAWLEARGVKVIRFWNGQLRREKESVREKIWQTLQERAPHPLPDYCRPMTEAVVRSVARDSAERAVPPHPGPLPQGEGVTPSAQSKTSRVGLSARRHAEPKKSGTPDKSNTLPTILPLPKGEGWGEGKPRPLSPTPNRFSNSL